jgi:hypothetical protein
MVAGVAIANRLRSITVAFFSCTKTPIYLVPVIPERPTLRAYFNWKLKIMSNSEAALELKAEGNALFVKGDWVGAHGRYTLAIAQNEKSAVLYANRAQCSLNLKR